MCGILFYYSLRNSSQDKAIFDKNLNNLVHRGPDETNSVFIELSNENEKSSKIGIGHTRLSINGVKDGTQPLYSQDNTLILTVNGEIYNHEELWMKHFPELPRKYKTDCEIILPLYEKYGEKMVHMLDGMFAFVIYNTKDNSFFMARDPIGIVPLYYNNDIYNHGNLSGTFIVSSECKCLMEGCINDSYYMQENTKLFPPGHSLYFDKNIDLNMFAPKLYYQPKWKQEPFNPSIDINKYKTELRKKLTSAVEKRLMTDVPFGVLLSGGLDSSLIASIASRLIKEKGNEPLNTFSIGLKGSPDLLCARKVADFLGTIHHECYFTPEEGIRELENLIWHLETYDITTIRASLPMYLLSKYIHEKGFKMVLSGEGADEILGGYLYFHQAPTNDLFHQECVHRIDELHLFDCLRANKSTMAWGVEARVPFLDVDFLECAMPIHPQLKCADKKEKWILRYAFNTFNTFAAIEDNSTKAYLPDEILWRQKEQFSDGVGYSWIDELLKFTKAHREMAEYKEEDREKEYYKYLFHKRFGNEFKENNIINQWVPRTEWTGVGADPSGRAQQIHHNSF
jgi:asparagine synthase (glutamine-hydrolysing)